DFQIASDTAYFAFQYRQSLQQRAGQYRIPTSARSTGGLVGVPASLPDLRRHAIGHLLSLAQSLGDAERTRLGEAMLSRGVASADLLVELPFSDPYRGIRPPFPIELLDRHPDRLHLWAKAVLEQGNLLGNSPGSIDAALLERGYAKFREDYPAIAFCAAVYAAASGSEEGATLLDRALAELPPLEELLATGRYPLNAVSYVLGSSSPFEGRRQTLLPDRFRTPLLTPYLASREARMKEAGTAEAASRRQWTFHPAEAHGWLLRGNEDLDAFADHL